MTRWSFVGVAGCLVAAATGCGGVIDASTLDAGAGASDAAQPRDASTVLDVSIAPPPADSSVTFRDGAAPVDTSVVTFDATVGFDVTTADVTAATCSANTPFTPLTWAPPTPLHQGKCTPAQTMAYISSLQSQTGPWTSGSAACDACLQTDETSASHGPIITQSMMGKQTPVELNFGGCVADFDGMKAAGGCGNRLDDNSDCVNQECAMCPDIDNPMPGGPTEMCEQQVAAAGGVCAADTVPPSCDAELGVDSGIQECTGMFQTILDVWCGP